jgi:hypothetical protein
VIKEFDMQWFLLGTALWLVLGALSSVTSVGKERKPISGGTAAVGVLIHGALAAGLIVAAVGWSHA